MSTKLSEFILYNIPVSISMIINIILMIYLSEYNVKNLSMSLSGSVKPSMITLIVVADL